MTIEEVVQYIADKKLESVKPSGEDEINALCPFHDETDGSFFLNRNTGQWFCHGQCNKGGGIFTLLRKLRLPTSLVDNIPIQKPKKKKVNIEDNYLPEAVLGVFHHCPTLLINEGFDEQVLKDHDVGFDERLQRITFPVRSIDKKLRLISGRTVIGEDAKYLIYKKYHLESIIDEELLKDYYPHKKYYFYREDKVKPNSDVVLCEGFKAALWLSQHGYNSIASIGVHLSNEDSVLAKLSNFNIDTLYIMYDSDPAGLVNSIESARTVLGIPKRIKFPKYPKVYNGPEDKLQPDDLSEGELANAFANAQPLLKHKKEVVRCLSNL